MQEIINKYKLDQKTWVHKGLQSVLHYFFPVVEQPIKPLLNYFGDCYDVGIFFVHDNYTEWYWHKESMDRLRKKFIAKVNEEPRYLQQLLDEWHKRIKRFDKIMQEVDTKEVSKLSDEELLKWYDKWYQAYLAEYGIAIGIQDAFSMRAETFLIPFMEKVLREKGSKNVDEDLLLLLSPVEESFITREIRDRIKIKQNSGKNISKDLKEHTKKYHWLQNNYAKDVCLDEKFFEKQLKDIKNPAEELKKLDHELKEIKEKKGKLISQLKLDQETKNLIKITEVFAYMQDERKKYVLLATHYERIFIEEIARRAGLNLSEMEYTHFYEMKDVLQGKFDKKLSVKRKKFCAVIFDKKGYDILAGKEAEDLFNKLFKEDNQEVNELKGVVASKGKVKGTVKIVRKTHDIINMQQGDILVSSMTRPEMILAMKKAAAIVTDEGGITSHAAVISRELGIPCIIGTKIATKVFKDGDLVEVDAEKGIVRKIK
ncbi:MAG: PEP-utilizing enzyme [Candidatus Woesearchaeota archaeon]